MVKMEVLKYILCKSFIIVFFKWDLNSIFILKQETETSKDQIVKTH